MGLKIISEELDGLILFQPNIYEDERGFFYESYKSDEFERLGLPTNFLQDNHSRSCRGVIRGMHFQWNKPMGKLIRATVGKVFVSEIDIRPNSPHLGKYAGYELSAENKYVLWVPAGFANGFCTISDWAEVQYKCTALWNPKGESGILWNDPKIGIKWPIDEPVLSNKDRIAQTLEEWLMKPESKEFI
jgi:dTDP-4-dehydrorhamnose 3,5-epimerase